MSFRLIPIVFLLFAFVKADAVAVIAADTTLTDTVRSSSTADTIVENPYNLPDELLPLWDSLTIKQKAAQMVMVYLSPANFLIEHEFGAVLVMKNHLKDTAAFKQRIREANASLKIPLLVASDQEGGLVNRLGGISEKWKKAPSAKEMRDMPEDSIEAIAADIGGELMELGINLNLAPVLDPAKDHRKKNSFMEESNRSWEKDSTSTEKVRAFVRGMKTSGVICVSKHFPGYDSWTNSDHQIAISASPKNKIAYNVEFFSRLASDIPVTMMSSVRFVRISSRPAVFEPKIVKMARDMDPETVILTDDLWGVSLRAWVSGTERVQSKGYPRKDFRKLIRTALTAGNDMFMITYPQKAIEMVNYMVQLSKQNKNYKKRIEESAARILKMKFKAGLLSGS
jgi:beta-N-acetylhexosaminidase